MSDTAVFRSPAVDRCGRPDYIDVHAVRLPPGVGSDPAAWAEEIFSGASIPVIGKVLLGLRQVLVRVLGVQPAADDVFEVDAVVAERRSSRNAIGTWTSGAGSRSTGECSG